MTDPRVTSMRLNFEMVKSYNRRSFSDSFELVSAGAMATINRWNALPEECKSMILSRLSTKEVARVARVSKEFLRAVKVLRSSVQLLVLPPTLSASALEGMVTAHPNVKSLSFKRCGGKLKIFIPIIKAAATGYVTVVENDTFDSAVREQKKVRSLTAIDFRNCMHLIDTDVSILCSLHSQLEEVDLTNCQFVTDTTLLTLSRYQHVERPSDPLEKYNCYPRVFDKASKVNSDTFTESEEMFLKDNDAAVFEEIQGLGLNSNNFRSWPRIGERPRKDSAIYPTVSSRKYEEGKILAASPYHSMSRRGDSSAAANTSTGLKKSYAQITAKSVEKAASCSSDLEIQKSTAAPNYLQSAQPPELDSHLSCIERVNHEPCGVQFVKPADLDPSLTFIDWSLCDLGKNTKSDSGTQSDVGLHCGTECPSPASTMLVGLHCGSECPSPASTMLVADDRWNSEIAATNRYRDMYKHYLIDQVEDSSCALPDLIENLCLSTVNAKDLSQAHYKPMLVQTGQSGSKYSTLETSVSDSQIMRTQTSFFIPKSPFNGVEGNAGSEQKPVCVAGGTEIRDQRVQVDPLRKPGRVIPNGNSEAFCRTINHVGIFAVPDADSKYDLDDICKKKSNSSYFESSRQSAFGETENSSQLAICLPDALNIGGILKRNMQAGRPTDGLARTCIGSDRSEANDAQLDLEIDVSKSIRGLKKVCVASCPEITDRGVQALLKGTSRSCLSTLDVSRCGGLTNAGLKLPARSGLQHLIAVQMPAISRLVYQLPIQSVLQHLNLAGCYKLEELVLVASSLKTLNLSNCKKLARLHLKCPSLMALNLSLCDGLERFIKFQCSALQSLNIMACRMLLQSSMNAAVESATILEELRCGGCDRVERLDLVQSTLLSLEVSGSQSLKRLFCRSKVLRAVDACGCKNLAEVYLYSPYLRRMLFSNCALLQILVIPLDAIKETMDAAAAQSTRAGGKPDELEISISGCNMPEVVKKNLAKLTKQWQSCFKSAT